MNEDAGRGRLLIVEVRLSDGEKLPLAVDTGSPMTAFVKSLEPKLGRRLESLTVWNFGVTQKAGAYAAPKLYLGDVPLQMTGKKVATFDPQKLADRNWPSVQGFLGMDVLRNYCIQLDFGAREVRFLNDEHADTNRWGAPFRLTDIGDGCMSINENLAGTKGPGSVVDSGCDSSGWLRPALYRQWTNQDSSADEKIYSPNGTLGGEIYHELNLRRLDSNSIAGDDGHVKFNGIGLRVLAENLVTLDFPNRTMYLKRTSEWPLASRDMEAAMKAAEESSLKSLWQLADRHQLPGLSKDDDIRTTAFHFNQVEDTATWDLVKEKGDSFTYHYTFTGAAKDGPWKLQKAWRTDQGGHAMEEYPVSVGNGG